MAEQRLPALGRFIDGMRVLYAEPMDQKDRFEKARPLLQTLLSDEELREKSKSWPSGNDHANRDYTNLLFYEDPDYGFVVNALVKDPGEQTPIHDHAHTWTLYGVLEGGEKVSRYLRADDGTSDERADLSFIGEHDVTPGYIDFVPPYEVHAEHNGDSRTIGVIVRSEKVGTFMQNWYDADTGEIEKHRGPRQVPYDLV